MNPIPELTQLGQSLWLDNIHRKMLTNGELETLIKRGDIRGVTSNPSIFHNAIAKSTDYDSALIPMAWAGWDAESIFWQLAVEDIQAACDLFLPLYDESKASDGYVSLEVSPYLAHDTEKTIAQVSALWERVNRPNLMVKIPATLEGLPAIRKSIASGINVNVTLIFSLARYAEVMDAYLSGLEDRLAEGEPIDYIASVASFFVSRIDSKVDALLPERSSLRGQAAIASARLAYEAFAKTFSGERWEALYPKGARLQRPLWASTSTKNPEYPDTAYVDTLIGPYTVNTVPPQTLEAFRDHGVAQETVTRQMDRVHVLFEFLEAEGVSMDVVTQELEDEGVKSFADAFTALLETIEERRAAAVSQLGPLAASVSKRIAQLEKEAVPARLWDGDPSLWTTDPDGQAEIKVRLGWLRLPETSKSLLPQLSDFADQVLYDGFERVLLLGMGGSSLAPEVLSFVFTPADAAEAEGRPCLSILDSTDPAQVAGAAEQFPPENSLYIVSSKSGGTTETLAACDYFWELAGGDGSHFVAITDPGTSLEKLAKERNFRAVFPADPNVGGRYSALTAFGLLPAALLGLDVKRLLSRAAWMMNECFELGGVLSSSGASHQKTAARNPGLALGVVLAEAALVGRDKLTILADAPLASLGSWLEQLIAESSGKGSKGIVPVDREPLGAVTDYGKDRLFVYLRQAGELDKQVAALREAGQPVLEISIPTAYDLGAEFYRWEVATAVACHILGVNAFDQPDVQDSKDRTKAKIATYQKKGALEAGEFVALKEAKAALKEFLKQVKKDDYLAVNAYLPRDEDRISALQDLRIALRQATGCAVTLGFGPRFLHSTGQLHKGGPDNGLFLQITADPLEDIDIPAHGKDSASGMSFGTLERAQALGDYEALEARGRRVLRLHLSNPDEVGKIVKLI
ncbi:MAG: bifunctional transaldolase/phosoglucose isomerase [Anaerolineales bacterium]|nr:bifunctional transaldolase/phosoglucose isomerase [Anaerolineales bacterium]